VRMVGRPCRGCESGRVGRKVFKGKGRLEGI
jgi:hypothetical protein